MQKFFISDSHTDLLTTLSFDKKYKSKSYFELVEYDKVEEFTIDYLKSFKLDTIGLAVFTTEKNIGQKDLKKFKTIIEKYNNLDLGRALFCVEDIGFINNFYALEELKNLNPFSVSLTWNFDNRFAGGTFGKSGLTEFGKFSIQYLEKNGVIIDTAHLNRKSFREFSQLTKKPIFNSHCNIYSIFNHKRNLLDKGIKRIIETNGYMGITLYEKFIKRKEINSYDIALQFNYLIEKFGVSNFGFGTDFFGINDTSLPADIENYNDLNIVAEHLMGFGYRIKDIKALMSKNFSNFVDRVENLK